MQFRNYLSHVLSESWVGADSKVHGYLSMLHNFVRLVLGQVPEKGT